MPGREDVTSAIRARRTGAFDYMVQPIETDALQDLVRRVLKDGELNSESPEASTREGDRNEGVLGGSEKQTLAGGVPGEPEGEETPTPRREPEWIDSLLKKEKDLKGGNG